MSTLFITGGSRGIGAATVAHAAASGHDVAFTYVNDADAADAVIARVAEASPDRKVRAYQLDVRDSAAVDSVADEVLLAFEGVDAVICNAGVNRNGLAYSMEDDEWQTVIDTNLTGSFYVCRAFLPELIANGGGKILLLSSVTAYGASGQAAYSASKAGLHGLAQTLAKEYGPKNVTTNVVLPGYFDTDMTRGEGMSTQLRDYATGYCPLRRLGELDELAQTMLFLLSPAAGFINGAVIPVTGGLDWAL